MIPPRKKPWAATGIHIRRPGDRSIDGARPDNSDGKSVRTDGRARVRVMAKDPNRQAVAGATITAVMAPATAGAAGQSARAVVSGPGVPGGVAASGLGDLGMRRVQDPPEQDIVGKVAKGGTTAGDAPIDQGPGVDTDAGTGEGLVPGPSHGPSGPDGALSNRRRAAQGSGWGAAGRCAVLNAMRNYSMVTL
ncbi:hypothetical protein GCM10009759_79160 [Kitasatospora saccharophila]|uniref:Uncharacterized protein n=1 Tax=Kitasatospora saccharophila TaxID=407973 RepID=A0ABP5K8W1_9ACTN